MTKTYSNPVTESVVALNELVLGCAPSSAMATMYLSVAHAAGMGAQNNIATQQNLNILNTAAVSAAAGNILWEGMTDQVNKLTMTDRLKNWEQLVAIISGEKTAPASGEQEGTGEEGAATAGTDSAEGA
ncbi:RebB family R body protein [Sneathiella chinensis]|uniref:Killing trait domain-containing protein n=1 Tax=Sneathiella chinensis TaxID=349750 RepID=A0ABQ5U697_9PROT|nr:RebB family R body protein [Sneathiella chinensis]GLQ06700.1 hypothetical protein GCM10007924_19210 [Sneathiella chinensis]